MKNKFLALILALAMALTLLTGCSGGGAAAADASAEPMDEQTKAIMEAVTEVIPQEAKDDVVNFLTNGALTADTVVMKAGGLDVTAGYYLFWLGREMSSMNSYYSQYGMTMDLDEEFTEGKSVLAFLQDMALRSVKTYYAIEKKATEKGLKLTAEQEKDLEDYIAGLDSASLAYYGTTVEDQRTTYTQNLYNRALNDALKESGELEASDETMADYVKDNGLYNCRYILFDVASDADEATDKEQKEKAQAAYDELSKLEGDALLEKFQEYQKNNADGNTSEFQFDPSSSIDADFRAKVEGMAENELGMTDKTSFGYFVLLRLPVDIESLKETYLSEAYSNMLDQWAEELEVEDTEAMQKLDAKAAATKLLELQESMNSAAQAAAAAADASAAGSAAVDTVDAADIADGSAAAADTADAAAASDASAS